MSDDRSHGAGALPPRSGAGGARRLVPLACALVLASCTTPGDGATGGLVFEVVGAEIAERGVLAHETADGWALAFDSIVVSVGEVAVADVEKRTVGRRVGAGLFDLARSSADSRIVLSVDGVLPGSYPNVMWALSPPAPTWPLYDELTPSVRDELTRGGAFLWIRGRALLGPVTKTFSWAFDGEARFEECEGLVDGVPTRGVRVEPNAAIWTRLTLRIDRVFRDDLVAPEARIRFAALAAADRNADDTITRAEMRDVTLDEARAQGGRFGTGQSASVVRTLDDFVAAQARRVGGFRGDGWCEPPRDGGR